MAADTHAVAAVVPRDTSPCVHCAPTMSRGKPHSGQAADKSASSYGCECDREVGDVSVGTQWSCRPVYIDRYSYVYLRRECPSVARRPDDSSMTVLPTLAAMSLKRRVRLRAMLSLEWHAVVYTYYVYFIVNG